MIVLQSCYSKAKESDEKFCSARVIDGPSRGDSAIRRSEMLRVTFGLY